MTDLSQQSTTRPNPDPSILTTEQVQREVANVLALFRADLRGVNNVIDERFKAVDKEFTLVERQRTEQKVDAATGIAAALSAAKEAVKEQTAASDKAILKTETATAAQLLQLNATITTGQQAQSAATGELKERIVAIEQHSGGVREHQGDTYNRQKLLWQMVAVALAVVGLIVTIGSLTGGKF